MSEPAAPPGMLSGTPTAPLAFQRKALALLEVVACSSLPTQLLITFALIGLGMPHEVAPGRYSLPFVVTLSLVDTVVLIALMTIITRAHGQSVAELWLGHRPVGREVALGLLLVPVIFVLVILLLNGLRTLAPWLQSVPENPLEQLARGGPLDAMLFALVAIFAGGVREELQRAFLLRRFEDHLGGAAVGVVVLSAAFGLGHWVQGLDAVITTGALGAFWAVVYLRRRSSIAPVVSHAGFNSLEVLRVAVTGA